MHSPHISSVTERISIDGKPISQPDYNDLAAEDAEVMQQAMQGSFGSVTHFEVLTALAFQHFRRQKVQCLLVVKTCNVPTVSM